MHVTRHGHAALFAEGGGGRILIDPGDYSDDAAFDYEELGALIFTHSHLDHVDLKRPKRLVEANPDMKVLAEGGACELLEEHGYKPERIDDGMRLQTHDMTVTFFESQHAVIHPDIATGKNVGVLIEVPDARSLFHPGDSFSVAVDVDCLALPLSAPWSKLSETIAFLRRVSPDVVFPIHDRALHESGYWFYWRMVEQLGRVPGSVLLEPDGSLDLEGIDVPQTGD